MKRTGKGLGISINEPNMGGISEINAWKQELGRLPPPVYVFKPLSRWPAVPHPRQAEIDAMKAIKSRFA